MTMKPIFVATHPRACSTAFERAFMTRRDILTCVHEPFGDAFYFGPERLSDRYEADEQERLDSGFHETTYKDVLDRIDREGAEGKRIFIKDIAHYLFPPNGSSATLAPSVSQPKKGVGTGDLHHVINNHTINGYINGEHKSAHGSDNAREAKNPTVLPKSILEKFHFTFLIRDPHSSIPSYYRCSVPPLDNVTGFYDFMPSEAGYEELRRLFDYLLEEKIIGPSRSTKESSEVHQTGNNSVHEAQLQNGVASHGPKGHNDDAEIPICVIDADDLLDDPAGVIEAYCHSVGLPFDPAMLSWDTDADHEHAKAAFAKWKGFHEDAIESREFRPRQKKAGPSAANRERKFEEQYDAEWRAKFGDEGAKAIRETVDRNMPHYEYLRQFVLGI